MLTNDDGFHADGLQALVEVLDQVGGWDLTVVAPDQERSASSMSLTILRSMRLQRLAEKRYVLDGFPADCVNVALHAGILDEFDMVISGINQGPNLGDDVHYSGTVAGARQGALKNLLALAISAPVIGGQPKSGMLPVAHHCAEWIQAHAGRLQPGLVYNINFPVSGPARESGSGVEFRYTRQGRRTYHDHYTIAAADPGQGVWQLHNLETKFGHVKASGTDFEAIQDEAVSITPLSTYTTDLEELQQWS
ncbi:MAG: 5'/3'-nucleotidase SurE [Leptospiraceae bacterium]|nr:5'/3'-nucleotidase SurE [Leptospiraceae bacterium]